MRVLEIPIFFRERVKCKDSKEIDLAITQKSYIKAIYFNVIRDIPTATPGNFSDGMTITVGTTRLDVGIVSRMPDKTFRFGESIELAPGTKFTIKNDSTFIVELDIIVYLQRM